MALQQTLALVNHGFLTRTSEFVTRKPAVVYCKTSLRLKRHSCSLRWCHRKRSWERKELNMVPKELSPIRVVHVAVSSFDSGMLKEEEVLQDSLNFDEEELEELFAAHGEVVYSRDGAGNSRPTTSTAEDDLETAEFAMALASVANESKGEDIRVLHVKPLVYWTSYFVIVTAFSKPQSNAICKKIKDLARERQRSQMAGDKEAINAWTLLDYGDVVVHIFSPSERQYYNIEEFYGNAESVPLNFA